MDSALNYKGMKLKKYFIAANCVLACLCQYFSQRRNGVYMLEVRFHGRGGQGIVVGSGILGMAYFYENNHIQFFPEFGVERRGAPVQAFLRVSDSKIRTHYSISEPDHLILFDCGLLDTINITKGLKRGGLILINSRKTPDCFKFDEEYKIATVDADKISLDNNLGNAASPIINAAIIGAFAKAIGNLKIDSVIKAITESVPTKINENILSAKTAFDKVMIG